MAPVAGCAGVTVSRPAHVLGVDCGLRLMGMAIDARERRKISRHRVAVDAERPPPGGVLAARRDREVGRMVERGGDPSCRRMAGLAVQGEPGGRMGRVRGRVVSGQMAAGAPACGGGSSVDVVDVTGGASGRQMGPVSGKFVLVWSNDAGCQATVV